MEIILATLALTDSVDALHTYADVVYVVSTQYELSSLDVFTLIILESGGDTGVESPIGAVGLLQVLPREMGFPDRPTRKALLNPVTNIRAGCKILYDYTKGAGYEDALKQYTGGSKWDEESWEDYLVKYNLVKEWLRNAGFEDNAAQISRGRQRKDLAYYGLSMSWDRHRNDWSGSLQRQCGDDTNCQ